MLSARTPVLLGRWGTRDFMRGRSKKGGAVHIRHTHGSKGRFKRLSTHYGLRDGRRHAGNRLKGGLGVKLGGGLFGLRIPRQHALATMTREEFELEVYGHPNITNPYRDLIEEHPALREVMANAAPRVELVVLMPRAPRHPSAAVSPATSPSATRHPCEQDRHQPRQRNQSGNDEKQHDNKGSTTTKKASMLPLSWQRVSEGLSALLSSSPSSSCIAAIRFCTLDSTAVLEVSSSSSSSFTSPLPLSLSASSTVDEDGSATALLVACLEGLYTTYQQGTRLKLLPETGPNPGASAAAPARELRGPFLGSALRADGRPESLKAPGLVPTGHHRQPCQPTPHGLAEVALTHVREVTSARSKASLRLDAMASANAANRTTGTAFTPSAPPRRRSTIPCTVPLPRPSSPDSLCASPSRQEVKHQVPGIGSGSAVSASGGIAASWRELKHRFPDSLCLCFRPSSLSAFSPTSQTQPPCSLSPIAAAAKEVEASLPEGRTGGSGAAASTVTGKKRAPPLLKNDTDPDEEVGVWRRGHPRSPTAELLKWFYSTHDPRAHSADAIPHAQRRLPVLLLVDASRLGTSTASVAARRAARSVAGTAVESDSSVGRPPLHCPPSLLSRQLSEELERAGFLAVAETALPPVLEAMNRWTSEKQWSLLQSLWNDATPTPTPMTPTKVHSSGLTAEHVEENRRGKKRQHATVDKA